MSTLVKIRELVPMASAQTTRGKEICFCQICVTISKVSPNMCGKSCQKFVTISDTSRSTLLGFCQIRVTITSHKYLALTQTMRCFSALNDITPTRYLYLACRDVF